MSQERYGDRKRRGFRVPHVHQVTRALTLT